MHVLPLATPGEVIDAWPSWSDNNELAVVLRTPRMEVMRLHIAEGAHVPTHEAHGEVTILCLQGRVLVEALEQERGLNAGQLIFLLVNEPFELFGQEESALLITTISHFDGTQPETIPPRSPKELPR